MKPTKQDWVRTWRGWWLGESMEDLSAHAKLVLLLLRSYIRRVDPAGVGWAEHDSGRPVSTKAVARLTSLSETEVVAALDELRVARWLVVTGDSRCGVPDWQEDQTGRMYDEPWARRKAHTPQARGTATFIYFIQAGGSDGPIKIGVSNAPHLRLAELQTGMPNELVLLATRHGNNRAEKELHQRFAADRIRGEWFRPSAAVLAAVEESR